MHFFYLFTPATWLKIALASLLLASASLWFLVVYSGGNEGGGNSWGNHSATNIWRSSDSAPNQTGSLTSRQMAANTESDTTPYNGANPVTAQPGMTQSHAIAPLGILDQYAEFAEVHEFDDAMVKPEFALPEPVAPPALLDPNWNGNPP